MESSLISNTNQVHFASVLAMDNTEMVAMFEALMVSGLNGFLGFQGKLVEISEEIFSRTFQLPVEGLIDINEVPKDLIFYARTKSSGEHLQTSCKKRELKIEYRILSDIVAKSISVKAGSFDVVTHERRGKPEDTLSISDSVEKYTKFGVGIFRGDIAINDKIAVENVEGLAGKSRVKKTPIKRAVSKQRPTVAATEPVVKKKRTSKGRSDPSKDSMKIVHVAQEAVPLQTIEPTPAVPAEQPPVPKRKSKKRRLRLQEDSDNDEVVEMRAAVEATVEADVVATWISTADDVDIIIEQVIAESAQLETDVGSPVVQKPDEMEKWFNLSYEEFVAREAEKLVETGSDSDGATETVACGTFFVIEPIADVIPTVEEKTSDDEAMTLELGLKDAGIDQPNFHSAQLGYLKLLQMGTQTQQDKAGNKYEVKPQYEELSKQLGGRHSHLVVTAPTIALDFSDTTQQSASHNVAPNQILNKDTSSNNSSLLPLKLPRKLPFKIPRSLNCSTQPFRVFAPAQHILQDWYEKKGLLERFPTLPRTLKTEVGINGKSR
ncbi:hypothetical protein F511_23119 [Dorcoceras hygrometricum]|uniref:Uncharacterized protein n=1 Tax=Dorcoceras hygrometricum TaxID=472368 RepID=A0A2Z7ADC6_9LAMI|nr:hypothetical protein F511_23119 [Dorcoceras hygrometricum]